MELMVKSGARYRRANKSEVCEVATRYLADEAVRNRVSIASPAAAKSFLQMQAGLEAEQFGIVYADTRHRVIAVEILFRGTIDGASVHPRIVVKRALELNSAVCLCFHNHPSGVAEPSTPDELITRRLKEALSLVDIRLLDHLILAGNGAAVSLAERGML